VARAADAFYCASKSALEAAAEALRYEVAPFGIAVQIVQQGAVKSELSLERGAPQWFASVPQMAGSLLNKNETPFAPLYWDRYEQIKATNR
jgi:short-subunit dehydrogenase